jgi:hypothetical protein
MMHKSFPGGNMDKGPVGKRRMAKPGVKKNLHPSTAGKIPVRINERTVVYMSPDKAAAYRA